MSDSTRCGIVGCGNPGWRAILVEINDMLSDALSVFDINMKMKDLLLCRDHFKLIRGSLDRTLV